MTKITNEARQALKDIVAQVQLAKRKTIANQIKYLADLLSVEENLLSDRRSTMWMPGGVLREKTNSKHGPVADEKKVLLVTHHGGMADDFLATYDEAAKYCRRTPGSLRVLISKGGGKHYFTVDVGNVTESASIQRYKPNEE